MTGMAKQLTQKIPRKLLEDSTDHKLTVFGNINIVVNFNIGKLPDNGGADEICKSLTEIATSSMKNQKVIKEKEGSKESTKISKKLENEKKETKTKEEFKMDYAIPLCDGARKPREYIELHKLNVDLKKPKKKLTSETYINLGELLKESDLKTSAEDDRT